MVQGTSKGSMGSSMCNKGGDCSNNRNKDGEEGEGMLEGLGKGTTRNKMLLPLWQAEEVLGASQCNKVLTIWLQRLMVPSCRVNFSSKEIASLVLGASSRTKGRVSREVDSVNKEVVDLVSRQGLGSNREDSRKNQVGRRNSKVGLVNKEEGLDSKEDLVNKKEDLVNKEGLVNKELEGGLVSLCKGILVSKGTKVEEDSKDLGKEDSDSNRAEERALAVARDRSRNVTRDNRVNFLRRELVAMELPASFRTGV
jgi:hypothetical protein